MATLAIESCRFNYLELAKKFLLSTIAENLTFSYIKLSFFNYYNGIESVDTNRQKKNNTSRQVALRQLGLGSSLIVSVCSYALGNTLGQNMDSEKGTLTD